MFGTTVSGLYCSASTPHNFHLELTHSIKITRSFPFHLLHLTHLSLTLKQHFHQFLQGCHLISLLLIHLGQVSFNRTTATIQKCSPSEQQSSLKWRSGHHAVNVGRITRDGSKLVSDILEGIWLFFFREFLQSRLSWQRF